MPEEDEAEAQPPPAPTTCAGCRALRRRCVPGCVFAPYFPAAEGGGDDDPSRFAVVHRVFGASNAARMLADVARPEDRHRAAETLVEEARARVRDPALGCVSYIAILQMLNEKAREQVDAVRAEIAGELGDEAAAEAVDVAEAEPAARAQAERALARAREKDAELRAWRNAADVEWWKQQRRAEEHAAGGRNTNEQVVGTENTAAAAAGESSSERTLLMTQAEDGTELVSTEGNGRPRQQMAETEEPAPAAVAAREREMLTPPAAASDQRRHLAAPHAGSEPGIPGLGQLHQKVLEDKQSSTAAAEAAREEAMASGEVTAAAPQNHESEATQLAGVGTGFLDGEQRAAAEALAKNLDAMIHRFTAAQQYQQDLAAAARYASAGLDVTPGLQQLPHLQMAEARQEAAAAGVASNQDRMARLAQQIAEAEAAAEQNLMMQLLAAGAPQYGDHAAQYDDGTELDVTLVHGHQDMRQQMMTEAEVAGEEVIPLAAEGAQPGHRNHPVAQGQHAQTKLGIALGHGLPQEIVQQLAAAANVAREQDVMPQVATAELAGEQETIVHKVAAAAELAREQEWIVQQARQQEMAMLLQAAAAPMAQYSETVQYSGATASFRLPGLGEAAPFLVEQQPAPQGHTAGALGLQLDSPMPPPLPLLGQQHTPVSQQQSTDGGGDEGQSSGLTAYLYY